MCIFLLLATAVAMKLSLHFAGEWTHAYSVPGKWAAQAALSSPGVHLRRRKPTSGDGV